ncbi:MAG TPA: NAD(P)/FAD-dependent oxidoreductase, partial [Thermodesulfovibrionales bacterium]|nr:NAD(P)/FAD-dependent oxidoreductase [Thermodesulfovibrionales bacterium]
MMLRTEVLVVGGGPAGSTAARYLAKNGVDTLLLDRNFSFVKPCGGGVPSFLFKEMDLPEHSARKHIDKIKVVSPKDDILDIDLEGASIAIVERGSFDQALRVEAERCGARLLEAEFSRFADIGRTVTSEVALRSPEPLSIEVAPGVPDTTKSRQQSIKVKADYVIAADGVNSRVRTALNIKPPYSLLTLTEKIVDESADVCEFWFGASHAPRCYSWVFPQGEGVSAGTGSLGHYEIRDLWRRFVLRRGLKTNGSARGYRVPLWQGDVYTSGKVLFAGDAAGQVMPMTFEGIYYAMKSGEMAAMAIAGRKIGEYRKLWERNFGRRFSLMRRLWTYFLKGDHRVEKIFDLHRRPEILNASMGLWLRKDLNKGSFLSY